MIKINYPESRYNFQQDYINSLKITNEKRNRFDLFKKRKLNIELSLRNISLDKILLADISELYRISNDLMSKNLSASDLNELKQIFNYDYKEIKSPKFQNLIKSFFEQNLKIKTCYFCNIDFINAFSDMGDYHDSLDFVMRATKKDLMSINGIKERAQIIINQRSTISSIDDLKNGIGEGLKDKLKNYNINNKSHFTLDHLLNKSSNPILALSLYNFVPSCFSCNSKFKGTNQIINDKTMINLSPTAKKFSINKKIKFRILFHNGKSISTICDKKDFIIDFQHPNSGNFKEYIDIFKLKGRYVFHKDDILHIIRNHQRYPDDRIAQLSANTGIPKKEIKTHLFGKELFYGNEEDKSLSKFKRDIAKNIGISGVK